MSHNNVLRFAAGPSETLRALFPERVAALADLSGRDPEFREICADYERACRRLAELETGQASPLQREYVDLRRDLIAEIAERIHNEDLPSPEHRS